MKYRLVRRADGSGFKLQCDAENDVLADFFETEIRDNPAFAAHILKLCQRTDTARSEISGNLYSLLIYKNNIELENLFDDEERTTIPRTSFEDILSQWIEKNS